MLVVSDWWILPLALFLVPVVIALLYNRLFKHKTGMNQNWVLTLLVTACWLSALVFILMKVW